MYVSDLVFLCTTCTQKAAMLSAHHVFFVPQPLALARPRFHKHVHGTMMLPKMSKTRRTNQRSFMLQGLFLVFSVLMVFWPISSFSKMKHSCRHVAVARNVQYNNKTNSTSGAVLWDGVGTGRSLGTKLLASKTFAQTVDI